MENFCFLDKALDILETIDECKELCEKLKEFPKFNIERKNYYYHSLSYFEEKAKKNEEYKYHLALRYIMNDVVVHEYDIAYGLLLFNFLKQSNNNISKFYLGYLYNLYKDYDKADTIFDCTNNDWCKLELGNRYYKAGEYEEAIEQYELGKDNSFVKKQLAECYMNGLGVKQDSGKGLQLIRESVEDNNPLGENYLGILYSKGLDNLLEKDDNKSIYYLTKSAKNGYWASQKNLYVMLKKQDKISEGLLWYELSTEQLHGKKDCIILCNLYLTVNLDDDKAYQWFVRAYPDEDKSETAYNFYKQFNDKINNDKWLAKAIDDGSNDAKYELYSKENNIDKILELANDGHLQSLNKYGEHLFVNDKYEEAYQYFIKSDTLDAYLNIALCYISGYGVEKDIRKGTNLIETEIEYGNGEAVNILNICNKCLINGKTTTVEIDNVVLNHIITKKNETIESVESK